MRDATDLLAYCEKDTLGTLGVLRRLREIAGSWA
jgi:hypothetical protein